MRVSTAVNLVRSFLMTRGTERAFYLAGFGDGLIVGAVLAAVVALIVL